MAEFQDPFSVRPSRRNGLVTLIAGIVLGIASLPILFSAFSPAIGNVNPLVSPGIGSLVFGLCLLVGAVITVIVGFRMWRRTPPPPEQ